MYGALFPVMFYPGLVSEKKDDIETPPTLQFALVKSKDTSALFPPNFFFFFSCKEYFC
jgi:hypothetical protein